MLGAMSKAPMASDPSESVSGTQVGVDPAAWLLLLKLAFFQIPPPEVPM